jgi:hypothetical protein
MAGRRAHRRRPGALRRDDRTRCAPRLLRQFVRAPGEWRRCRRGRYQGPSRDSRGACDAGGERSGGTGRRAYRSGTGHLGGVRAKCGRSACRCTRSASGIGLIVKVQLPGRSRG